MLNSQTTMKGHNLITTHLPSPVDRWTPRLIFTLQVSQYGHHGTSLDFVIIFLFSLLCTVNIVVDARCIGVVMKDHPRQYKEVIFLMFIIVTSELTTSGSCFTRHTELTCILIYLKYSRPVPQVFSQCRSKINDHISELCIVFLSKVYIFRMPSILLNTEHVYPSYIYFN